MNNGKSIPEIKKSIKTWENIIRNNEKSAGLRSNI